MLKFGLRRSPPLYLIESWLCDMRRLARENIRLNEEKIAQQAARNVFPDYRRIWYSETGATINVNQVIDWLNVTENLRYPGYPEELDPDWYEE